MQKNKTNKEKYILEITKWISAGILLISSIIGNYLYCQYNIYMRSVVLLLVISVASCIILTTTSGKLIIKFGKEAHIELKKVVWPTYKDGLNTTLIIIGVTIIMSLLLWGLDTVLVYIISFGLKL
ncbi:preprotein translocase subunit SecE [Candidatus Blochmannia ocreatus (nom. nud.)]|uniref:Protein translocase subunit SecE n=1 Tax=Candidatus Blochmannia ocreatus (nom. nud.) TaxID=251538 RepID=A0ABY4SXP6_9ENTR|nr:preprotein translocase subunit SecE [Candidatus Blochmannia ocreatus]URJ25038.1 preprotein translocase subunit SecE [Candidatus Blochmannia ocreatus]